MIPPIMEERLLEIGDWLKVNGEAIYATHPWTLAKQWPQNRRKHMGVLMGVKMRWLHPDRLQALDLSAGLSFDLGRVELVAEGSHDKVIELDTKLAATVLRAGLQQACYSIRRQYGLTVEEYHVAAHA